MNNFAFMKTNLDKVGKRNKEHIDNWRTDSLYLEMRSNKECGKCECRKMTQDEIKMYCE